MDGREFSLKEVTDGLQIPRERFKEWVLRGFVTASIQQKQGSRTFNSYSVSDLYYIAFFKHLIEHTQLPREHAHRIADSFRKTSKWNETILKACYLKVEITPVGEFVTFYAEPTYDEYNERVEQKTPIHILVGEDFDTIHIINFNKIRRIVKTAFDLE